jgi:HAD superfamily hydrolase (TIGR01509 family)
VLVDDERVHLEAFRDVLTPLGVTLSDGEYWDRYLGFDDAGAFREILADRGRPSSESTVRALVDAKRPRYLERARLGLRAFDGAADLVRRRAAQGPVAIVSGALRDEIALGLSLLGVTDLVSGVVSAESTERSKPDPEGYLLGVSLLARLADAGVARRALVIEDSLSGVEAARAAGLACVAVAHSYPAETLRDAGAHLAVETLAELTDGALRDLAQRLKQT